MRRFKSLPAAFLLAVIPTGCGVQPAAQPPKAERSLFAMNTYMTFTAYGDDAQDALIEAENLIQEVERNWSVTDEGSEIAPFGSYLITRRSSLFCKSLDIIPDSEYNIGMCKWRSERWIIFQHLRRPRNGDCPNAV